MDDAQLKIRAAKIKILMLDVDGVMTDGRIVYGDYGDELKFFDVQDGLGLVMLKKAGFHTIIVSAKKSRINVRRAKELKITKIFQKASDKLKIYEQILKKFKVNDENVCYIGDDLIDLPVLLRAGLAVSVPNGVDEVRQKAHWVTERSGGRGAVREVTDFLLKAQDKWREILKH